MKKGFLLVISGPSGVGKGTVLHDLMNTQKNLVYSVSVTTRKQRPGEIEGVSYFFKSHEEFEKMIEEDKFLEYAKVHDNYYGTPKDFVEEKINEGKIVILEIDVQGALNVKKNIDNGVYIFLAPPSLSELKNRIVNRGTETESDINLRMHNARKELSYIKDYDYLVVNDHLNSAINLVNEIINAEKHKVFREEIDFEKE
ncbi:MULTISPECIES: guanylate kinase [Anaerococcus]|uniref:Guanylate kinase n=3 Tax=Anaerococcus TaxID=165779 RepID=C7HU47_9FIRM|nr:MULTISPECIES: guanylate kinase [Anaerococcus]EEU12827.1 guanylate kinase [Anaerococcus vaginalis ATCC 51170]MBS4888529.1 guanylate kinase [Anaerococcus vaginalis]MBS6920392.1 guanylate kinase [Anaerococcus vaginalis]MDD7766397.1 guanylate kinase [Anaerococcus vaginalis]MDU0946298.1 guanylate kinase [Anaerococcus vaginalis]